MGYEYIYVDPGTGRKVAVDQYVQASDTLDLQIVKLAHGADGMVDGLASTASPLPVKGHKTFTLTPNLSPSVAYASGDCIGGKFTLANAVRMSGGGGEIMSVTVADKVAQNAPIDLIVFDADPGGTTFTDNAPLTIASADLLKINAIVGIVGANYNGFVGNSAACLANLRRVLNAVGTTLYACLISRGTPTYASASDLQVKVVIEQD